MSDDTGRPRLRLGPRRSVIVEGPFRPIDRVDDREAIDLFARTYGLKASFPSPTQDGEEVPVLVLRANKKVGSINWTSPELERAAVVVNAFTGVFDRARADLVA